MTRNKYVSLLMIFFLAFCLLSPLKGTFAVFEDNDHSTAVHSKNKGIHSINMNGKPNRLDYVDGELLVRFQPGAARKHEMGVSVQSEFNMVPGLQAIKLPSHLSVEQAMVRYNNNPNVLYAEPNYIFNRLEAEEWTPPNDPEFPRLWGLENTGQFIQNVQGKTGADIRAMEAWGIENGTSHEVIVAVIDTGIDYTHPDLAPNMWGGKNFVKNEAGYDSTDYMDYDGHGTHIAGTIAASGNNSIGITGVMWEAKLMALRVFPKTGGGASSSDIIEAIQYANANGADVVNMSLGGTGYSEAWKDALAASEAVIVVAAGNATNNNDVNPTYPANYEMDHLIAVAATNNKDRLASFSNYGANTVHVAAPGEGIYSTDITTGPDYSRGIMIFEDRFDNLNNWSMINWAPVNNPWSLSKNHVAVGTNSLSYIPTKLYSVQESVGVRLTEDINLKNIQHAKLTFELWMDMDPEANLQFFIKEKGKRNYVSHGWLWTGNTNGNFHLIEIDLSVPGTNDTYIGKEIDEILFLLESPSSDKVRAIYIDDIKLMSTNETSSGYSFMQGTSMAAPHVAGIAGLMKAANPDLSNVEIVKIIKDTVDPMDSLSGMVSTSGRVNASSALQAAVIMSINGEGGTSPSDPERQEATVNSGGGIISIDGAEIILSEGSVDDEVVITIQKITEIKDSWKPANGLIVSDIYNFTKDSEDHFNKLVQISITADFSKVNFKTHRISIFWLNEETLRWKELDNVRVNIQKEKVSGDVDHFTKFAVLAIEQSLVTDIIGNWAEANIRELIGIGAIKGYKDGTFKPNNQITRAEFTAIVVRALGLELTQGKVFKDTENHWAKEIIATAHTHGIISGYDHTNFGANDLITREQMATIVVNAYKLTVGQGKSFSDQSEISTWALDSVQTTEKYGIIEGYNDGSFRPKRNATRGEAATVMLRALKVK